MQNNITIFADADIVDAIEKCLNSSFPSFNIESKADSYQDCFKPPIQNISDIYILQAKSPIVYVDDLLIALQTATVSPVYILFEVLLPDKIRFATTTSSNPLALKVAELFQNALNENYQCELINLHSTLLNADVRLSAETAGRHESLLEILRGCSRAEFLFYREKFGLDLKDNGYYLFFWELMSVEFTDHEYNKFIYNLSGQMLQRDCSKIINQYNGGEVFYSTPNLLCIIINDLDIKSQSDKRTKLEEMFSALAFYTGNKAACRYLSDRLDNGKGLRQAYERYHSEKSFSFFLKDMLILRPQLIETRKRFSDITTINTLQYEIANFLRYDLFNQELETALYKLYFNMLKPAMSFTLYYSSTAAIYNAVAEIQYSLDDIMPSINNNPTLLQFSSIEEQYNILLKRIDELRSQLIYKKRSSSAVVLKAINYIEKNYARDITIADISNALFISKTHLSQLFKKEMGIGVIKYLIAYRIEKAKHLLDETDDFVYEIADAVGFHDFRHFSKTFKEITGTTPTRYRDRH